MLTSILMIAAVAAVLIILLIIYGRRSKDPTPLMGNGCNGDCAHCAVRCEQEDEEKNS